MVEKKCFAMFCQNCQFFGCTPRLNVTISSLIEKYCFINVYMPFQHDDNYAKFMESRSAKSILRQILISQTTQRFKSHFIINNNSFFIRTY